MLPTHQPYTTAAHPSNASQLIPLLITGKRYRRSDSDSDSDSSQGRLKKLKQKEQSAQLSKNHKLFSVMNRVDITQEARIEKIKKALAQGANVNAQDLSCRDNTPLHLAVQNNEPQVVKLLLERGADINIKNRDGRLPIDLCKKRKSNGEMKYPEVHQLLTEYSKNHQSVAVSAIQEIGTAGSSGLQQRGASPQSGTSEPLEYAAGGLKHSLHGNIYQLQLLILFMKRALDNNYDFLLATEMNAAEKFDDVVFRYTEQGETHYRFLQAKHRQEETQRLTLRDLTNQSEGDFSLSKYFASYLKIKDKSEFQGHQDFILCTNIDLAVEELRGETFTVEEIKVQDSFINIQDSTKTPHRYRLTVDKLSDFYKQLKVNPEARQLATVLMERLEKGGKLDLTVDIFKRYHRGLVENHIIDVPNNKLHSDFVSNQQLSSSAKSFRAIFIQIAGLKNKIYQKEENIWNELKDKKLSISKNFGSGDETSPFPTNSAIAASEIDAFFKQFTLAVNQPNENQLRTVLAREIGRKIQFNLLNSELAADHIQRQMLDWFKERGGKFLSAQDGKQYFAQASARINTLLSTGCSIEQAAKLANYGIHFSQDAITALQNSMQMELRVLHLITAETRLEALKVYQSLQTLPGYQQRDSVLFTELSTLSLKKLRQQLFKAFNADKSHPLLVIECSSETINGDITEIVGQLTSILESPSQKKLIIIAPQTHPLAEAFNEHPTLSYHSVVEAPTFSELAAKTQQALLDKEVLFQGHRVTLQQLLPSDFPRDTLPLMNLIQSSEEKPLPIGAALPPTPSEVGGYYLERLVTPPLIKYSITQALPADFTDLLAFNEQSFNTMCQDHPRKAVHWLQRMQHNALLLWRQSRGDTTALQPYVEDSPHAIAIAQKALASADFSTLSQLESHRVVLLSAPAGMGKSTFLTHTAQQLKRQQPDHWVIRIDLNQQTEALQHLQHPTVTAAAEWVVEDAQLHNSFEQPLLRQALQLPRSAKVRILLDGFDEISPTHQTSALKLLEGLREQQIWVTTRPHWEERLAQHCQTLPFSLKPLSDSEQQRFLTDYCRAQHQLEPTQVTAVEKSAEALLNHLVRSDISTENPLQLQMLAELFSDNFKTRQSFPETELKRFSRLELYEQFVKTKYKIFRHKGSEAGAQIDKVTKSSIDVENNHQRLAVTLLFPEQQQWLLTALSLNKIKLLSPEALARYGMVTGVKNAPQFIHRTYAEYFIAELLWERVIENPKTSPAVADFLLCEVLSQKAQQGVNAFLEGWLSKERSQLTQESYAHYGNRLKALQASERPLHLSRGDGSVSNAPQRAL
ncbi:MAG: ankyrin repeat domain-containing protein [Candidatus Symbiodolus clandestinus]